MAHVLHLSVLVGCTLLGCARLQVTLKVLKQGYFLLELFREFIELVLGKHVLLL